MSQSFAHKELVPNITSNMYVCAIHLAQFIFLACKTNIEIAKQYVDLFDK